jgi:hypothetical protein
MCVQRYLSNLLYIIILVLFFLFIHLMLIHEMLVKNYFLARFILKTSCLLCSFKSGGVLLILGLLAYFIFSNIVFEIKLVESKYSFHIEIIVVIDFFSYV